MHGRNYPAKVFGLIGFAACSVAALCIAQTKMYDLLANTTIDGRRAVIFSENSVILLSRQDPVQVLDFDTLYETDLLASLEKELNAHDIAVVAKVTEARQFIPPFSEGAARVFASESVTVHIETVLKGVIGREWRFINTRADPIYYLITDPLTGESTVMETRMSHSIPGYGSILNRRFMLFLNNDSVPDSPDSAFTMPIPEGCSSFSTYAYEIDESGEIHFDGVMRDEAGSFKAIPELKVPLTQVLQLLQGGVGTIAPPKRSRHASFPASFSGPVYDLLGKKIAENPKGIASGRSAGVQIRTRRTSDGSVLMGKSVSY